MDLESANGVRVGGVEGDRIELQSGDVIELGEVRLRFLSGDSALYDEPRAWHENKRLLGLAVGGGAVAVGLLLIFAFSGSPGGKVTKVPPPVENKPPVAPTVQPTPPTPPPVAEEPQPAEPQVPVEELLAQAKKKTRKLRSGKTRRHRRQGRRTRARLDRGGQPAQSHRGGEAIQRKARGLEDGHGQQGIRGCAARNG